MSNLAGALRLERLIAPPGLVRIILAAIVIVSHMSSLDIGRAGVILFFILSGYWVTKVYLGEYGRNVPQFFISRLWRLGPLYLTCLVLASLIRSIPLEPSEFFLIGVASTGHDPTGVAWSLDIEMQFYAALPLLVLLWTRTNDAVFLLVCAVLTGLGWFLSLAYGIETFARFAPAFMAGMLMTKDRLSPGVGTAIGWLGVFVALLCILPLTSFGSAELNKLKQDIVPVDAFSMILVLPLLPYIAASVRRRSSRLDRAVGNISYPLYLVHFPIISVLTATLHGVRAKLLALVLSIVVALILYFVVDRPFEWLRKRETRKRLARMQVGMAA